MFTRYTVSLALDSKGKKKKKYLIINETDGRFLLEYQEKLHALYCTCDRHYKMLSLTISGGW